MSWRLNHLNTDKIDSIQKVPNFIKLFLVFLNRNLYEIYTDIKIMGLIPRKLRQNSSLLFVLI